MTLTEAGALFLRHAEAIGDRLAAARADMEALAAGTAGTLRIGAYQSVSARVLPQLVRRFSEAWPRVEVELVSRPNDDELLDLLERGELDVAFVMLPAPAGPFESAELLREPYYLVARRGAELPDSIGELPLVLYRSCRSADDVLAYVRSTGCEVRPAFGGGRIEMT